MKTGPNSKFPKKKPRGKPFQPGQSGNPKGRPKNVLSLGQYLRDRFEAHDYRELDQVIKRVMRKKPEVLLYYAYGKPLESVELTNPDGSGVMEPLAVAIAQALAQKLDATSDDH